MCVGIIGTLSEVWDEGGVPMGRVTTAGGSETACLLYVPDADLGRQVLVHLGFVTEILDPDRAAVAIALREEVEGHP